MGDRKQPSPPPGDPGYKGPPQRRPDPPPPPPPKGPDTASTGRRQPSTVYVDVVLTGSDGRVIRDHHQATPNDGSTSGLFQRVVSAALMPVDPTNHHNALTCPYCTPDLDAMVREWKQKGRG